MDSVESPTAETPNVSVQSVTEFPVEKIVSTCNSPQKTIIEFPILACRICLQSQEENETCPMFPIFQSKDNNKSDELLICDKIQNCTGIKIQNHQKLPSLMCKNCLIFLNIAHTFASICRNSQKYLHEYVLETGIMNDDLKEDVQCDGIVEECQRIEEADDHEENELQNPSEENITTMECYDNEEEEIQSSLPVDRPAQIQYKLLKNTKDKTLTEDVPLQQDLINSITKDSVTITSSKILAISSDGTAIIAEKSKKNNSTKPIGNNPKKTHTCEICGNAYGRRYELQAHIRRHHDVKPFECEICGQAFHSNFELSRHMRKHTGLRPYECKYCKRTFGDSSTLTKHERIHRNERPYACKTCGKTFTYSSVLKVHQLTHTGEKPYNCELCGRRFSRSHHLRAHLETLLHSNDPRSKILLKRIKRDEDSVRVNGPSTNPSVNM
ncbi:zinc finger protein 333 [Musca vetustissima]|uniref:zinc finger protein 333 n=1 Tax=Musca vetustissima TaxID=27455 RepID=UPI002AB61173|nr:zinc finger protein 333 [Musca vetustissima]